MIDLKSNNERLDTILKRSGKTGFMDQMGVPLWIVAAGCWIPKAGNKYQKEGEVCDDVIVSWVKNKRVHLMFPTNSDRAVFVTRIGGEAA